MLWTVRESKTPPAMVQGRCWQAVQLILQLLQRFQDCLEADGNNRIRRSRAVKISNGLDLCGNSGWCLCGRLDYVPPKDFSGRDAPSTRSLADASHTVCGSGGSVFIRFSFQYERVLNATCLQIVQGRCLQPRRYAVLTHRPTMRPAMSHSAKGTRRLE